jgi:hypothetical protein
MCKCSLGIGDYFLLPGIFPGKAKKAWAEAQALRNAIDFDD